MQWVYAAGTSKPRRRQTLEQQETRAAVSSGFFSSIFSAFGASRAESPHPEPVPVNKAEEREREIEERKGLLNMTEAGVVLAVFSAQVDVKLDDSTRRELLRATKKNAPSRMKYELIYVSSQYVNHDYVYIYFSDRKGRVRVKQEGRRSLSIYW